MRCKGIVQKGLGRGQKLGFPTINIEVPEQSESGIFAARVFIDGKEHPAAAYANPSRTLLEAHLLDVSEDLYGREAEIELLEKIRDDKKFADDAELQAAIAEDVKAVRQYFGL